MLLKQQRDKEMKSYVDGVLKKHQEYNDLQLKYETIMTSPITCVESFRNFCKIVHEECMYKDYEIQNYLTLKGVTKL